MPAAAGVAPARFAVLAVAASALLLPALTRGRTALPVALPVAFALGALLLVALAPTGAPRRREALLAALVGFASASAFLAPGLVLGHDTRHHVWGAWAYLQEWHAGNFWPLWLHQLGLGLPMPLFYGPLPFWAMAPAAAAAGAPVAMLESSFVAAAAAAGVAAWAAAAIWTRDRRAALVAAVAWSFAPYRLLVSNYRASLGEAWALALAPLVLVACDRALVERGRKWPALAAVAVALTALAHPLSLLVLALVLPLFALVRVGTVRQPTRERAASLLRGTAGPLAGLALAGFFLVPLVVGSPEIHLEAVRGEPGAERYAEQFVRLPQLYVRELWDETRWSLRPGAERRGMRDMPYYFGVVLAAALVVTAVAGARRRGADEPPLLALATVGIVSFALVLEPSARLLAAVPGLPTLQFPWRFLGPASVAAALGLALLAHRAEGAWRRLPALGASLLALAALGDGFPYSGAVGRAAPWDGLVRLGFGRNGTGVIHGAEVARPWPLRVKGSFFPPWRCCADVGETFWVYPEYFTPAARRLVDDPGRAVEASIGMYGFVVEGRIRAWPYARLWRPGAQRAIALPFRRGGGEIVVELPRGARGRVEIAEQHFPGWQVEVDGRWQEAGRGANGLIEAVAMRRSRTLRFRFERWRADRVAGWILSLLAAGGLVAAVRRDPLSRRTR